LLAFPLTAAARRVLRLAWRSGLRPAPISASRGDHCAPRNRQACSLHMSEPVVGNGLARSVLFDNILFRALLLLFLRIVGTGHALPSCSSLRTPRITRGRGMPRPYNIFELVVGNGLARSVLFDNILFRALLLLFSRIVGAGHALPSRSSLRTPRITRGRGMPRPCKIYHSPIPYKVHSFISNENQLVQQIPATRKKAAL